MALILRYRVEPHPGINNEIYAALTKQVGKVGITIGLPIGPEEDPERTVVQVTGQFISVEGEHAAERALDVARESAKPNFNPDPVPLGGDQT